MRYCILLCFAALGLSMCSPRPQTDEKTCLTGKLVKRGICGQRVIQLSGEVTGGMAVAQSWTDSLAHKSYQNVFTVSNPCSFPSEIKEGEEFSFTITTKPDTTCIQCMAYTPVPEQKNSILVGCPQ
ncbi:hypothetical protein [Sediminibacterium soli]|uniref:hypothetical protein n=1 Tax=Sediminibacterium soli TaxID=2698829 RepID=UPI00137A5A59|nr:hypothetical protein [Sediminibacterium soli]NCI45647.1 hypothetical protein [Sediminibacterium soli]